MESLSILIMNWRDIRNPAAGGAEVFTHEVAKRWASWGHEVTIFTSRFDRAPAEETLEGVRVVRDGNRITVYSRAKRAYLERFRNGTDVVVDEINTRPFFAPRYVDGGTAVCALIYQLAREYWFYETPFPVSVIGRYWLENRWLSVYKDVPTATVSPSTQADLLHLGFRDVTIIPVGLSVSPLRNLPEKDPDPTLIYVGRLKRTKLPDHALRAFAHIKQQLPRARLWVVGDGYLREKLERNAPPDVAFVGRVPEEVKLELMRRSHILLYPAIREGWGLAVLEASALGTVAVGYDVPGLRDSIVNGVTGKLVTFGDYRALASEALRLLRDPEELERLARGALEHSRKFNWDQTAAVLLAKLKTMAE